jgi:hypothetical protein
MRGGVKTNMSPAVFAAVALRSVVALAGFAGTANASATVDLIWIDITNTTGSGLVLCLRNDISRMGVHRTRNCPDDPRSSNGGHTISSVNTSNDITLGVVLTAGANGSIGAGVSVNYGDALPKVDNITFTSFNTAIYLPSNLGTTSEIGTYIDNQNSAATPFDVTGIGLSPGQSVYLGTVTFHKGNLINGTVDITVGTNGPGGTDDVLDGVGNTITGSVDFNDAELINVGPTATPTAAPSPTPTSTPTATQPPSGCRCVPKSVKPRARNLATLKDVATGGKGSSSQRVLIVKLEAEDVTHKSCPEGATSNPVTVSLRIEDDDGDVLIDQSKSGFVCVGQRLVGAKFVVRYEGPKNCKDSAVPTGRGDLFVTVTTEDGSLIPTREIVCHR